MKELEKEIEKMESMYSSIEKTKDGNIEDWYASGVLEGLRRALRIVNKNDHYGK